MRRNWRTHRIRVKKFKQNLRENYSKSTKIAITACKFSKFFRASVPPDSLEPFLLLIQFQLCSAKKIHLKKNVKIMPPLFKFLATPLQVNDELGEKDEYVS